MSSGVANTVYPSWGYGGYTSFGSTRRVTKTTTTTERKFDKLGKVVSEKVTEVVEEESTDPGYQWTPNYPSLPYVTWNSDTTC